MSRWQCVHSHVPYEYVIEATDKEDALIKIASQTLTYKADWIVEQIK